MKISVLKYRRIFPALLALTIIPVFAGGLLAKGPDNDEPYDMICHEGTIASAGRWSNYQSELPELCRQLIKEGKKPTPESTSRLYIRKHAEVDPNFGDINPGRNGELTGNPPGNRIIMIGHEKHSVYTRSDGSVYEIQNRPDGVAERLNVGESVSSVAQLSIPAPPPTSPDAITEDRTPYQAEQFMVLQWKDQVPLDHDGSLAGLRQWYQQEHNIETTEDYKWHEFNASDSQAIQVLTDQMTSEGSSETSGAEVNPFEDAGVEDYLNQMGFNAQGREQAVAIRNAQDQDAALILWRRRFSSDNLDAKLDDTMAQIKPKKSPSPRPTPVKSVTPAVPTPVKSITPVAPTPVKTPVVQEPQSSVDSDCRSNRDCWEKYGSNRYYYSPSLERCIGCPPGCHGRKDGRPACCCD